MGDNLLLNGFKSLENALKCRDVLLKCKMATEIEGQARQGVLSWQPLSEPMLDVEDVGRPAKPDLVPPRELKPRKLTTELGRVTLIHALAHIEFNAVNLALDAAYRFPTMSDAYRLDWLRVAKEEAYHFTLLNEHLGSFGYAYGDFPGHSSLWEMAINTQDSVVTRMALVPRLMEARGLDVAPGIADRLLAAGDRRAYDILQIIIKDEIGHVEIGNHWYHLLCEERGIDALSHFVELVRQYAPTFLRGPLNIALRRLSGFTEQELEHIESLIQAGKSHRTVS